MAYCFGIDHSDQTLDHLPEFKAELDGCVARSKSVVYVGWRPHDSGYKFFDWLQNFNDFEMHSPTTLLVEAWKPNVDALNPPFKNCFKTCGRAEFLLDIVPSWMRDCVVWQDGPEHLTRGDGKEAVRCWQENGFKSIVVSTPDGWLEQDALDGNHFERHLSAWDKELYGELNFKVDSYSAGLIGYWKLD